jgi:hypothetical protein
MLGAGFGHEAVGGDVEHARLGSRGAHFADMGFEVDRRTRLAAAIVSGGIHGDVGVEGQATELLKGWNGCAVLKRAAL